MVHREDGSRVLLPSTDANLVARLQEHSVQVVTVQPVDGPADALTTRTCAALRQLDLADPVTVIAAADAALMLPAVARSLRAQGREVCDYVLVEPHLPEVTDAWPDAPVTVYATTGSAAERMAGLRGWSVHGVDELPGWDRRGS